MFAPRMWRCFYKDYCKEGKDYVCSTHVEMFPSRRRPRRPGWGLLHACGDVSIRIPHPFFTELFAPRMWRCFGSEPSCHQREGVCSTHVEIFPCRGPTSTVWTRFAPRMWRCFRRDLRQGREHEVCSTHVEMFPPPPPLPLRRRRLLHACGDVSLKKIADNYGLEFAPRMWRCFLTCPQG